MNTKKLLLRLGAAMSFALVALHIGVIFVSSQAEFTPNVFEGNNILVSYEPP